MERPASVVKELVENALDAGADEIELALRGGGRDWLRVRDDGSGMPAEDALLAFDRHATSKLTRLEDLQSIATLGFRGEALAAIAAVSEVDLLTASSAGSGFHVRIEGGVRSVAEPVAHPRGTTVEVASLFYNVPARRKFVKQPATEQRHCREVVNAYALYHRQIGFSISNESGEILLAPPVPNADHYAALRTRVTQLFQPGLADHLIPFGDDPDRADAVWGMVGDRQTVRGRKSFVFVNGRLLRDRGVVSLFYRAARDEWGSGEFPSLFLFLQLPADQVDVNVHPQKHEVRFRDAGFNSRLYRTFRRGLAQARGHEDAPLENTTRLPGTPAAWQGLGRRPRSDFAHEDGEWRLERSVAEGGNSATASVVAERLAEPSLITAASTTPIPLSGRDGVERPFRILGQYKAAVVLVEGPDGLYLIDQHVAHERVLYERLLEAVAGATVEAQQLVTPLLLELAADESEKLIDAVKVLAGAGFEYEVLSGDTLAVSATPSLLSSDQAANFLLEVARSDVAGEQLAEGFRELLAASLSCRSAVKMHDVLTLEELQQLLSDLFDADNPYACPHGRPVMLRMSDRELEKRFHRR